MIGTTDYKGYNERQLGAVFAGAFVQCNDWNNGL